MVPRPKKKEGGLEGMECNRPEQVTLGPGKLRARAPILCPRLGCTYLKQTPLCIGPIQNFFGFWPAPEAFFRFSAHFVERNRQPQTSVYTLTFQLQVHVRLGPIQLEIRTRNSAVPRHKFAETARPRHHQLCSIARPSERDWSGPNSACGMRVPLELTNGHGRD